MYRLCCLLLFNLVCLSRVRVLFMCCLRVVSFLVVVMLVVFGVLILVRFCMIFVVLCWVCMMCSMWKLI